MSIELSKLKEFLEQTFSAKNIEELTSEIFNTVLNNNIEIYKKVKDFMKDDLSNDFMQVVYQYYLADREKTKQDFTPISICKMVQKLSETKEEKNVIDLCAGTGALTIQKWNKQKELKYTCKEYTEDTIPYLLFNLAIRNIDAMVYQEDVLTKEILKVYKVIPCEEFAKVEETQEKLEKYSSCISNPPYNIGWNIPIMANAQSRFLGFEVPPSSNANYAFILTALDEIKEKAVFVLPCGVLTTTNKKEEDIRRKIISDNLIESVIILPDKMFESTNIPTCLIVFNKNKISNYVEMVDLRKSYDIEIREQKGQYGGNSHTNRVYEKEVKVISEKTMNEVCEMIANNKNIVEKCKSVDLKTIAENEYILTPSRYIEFETKINGRNINDIVSDLNRCISLKNACKLTINETTARGLGFENSLYKNDIFFDELNKTLKNNEFQTIQKENHITLTKNKNEMTFSNGSKETHSHLLTFALNAWKQHIVFMNTEENRYLAELRDVLLEKLMSGEFNLEEKAWEE
ncbi:MAG: N-6 DNA methylase [Clostridia bacterium]